MHGSFSARHVGGFHHFVGPAFPPFPFCLVSDIPLLQAYLQSRLSGEVHEEQLVMGKVVVDLVAKVLF